MCRCGGICPKSEREIWSTRERRPKRVNNVLQMTKNWVEHFSFPKKGKSGLAKCPTFIGLFPSISCPELKEPHPYLTISHPVILWLLGRYLQCDIVVTLYNVQCSFVQLCNIGNVSRHHILASAYFNWQNHAKNWGLQICFDVNAKEMAAG